LCDSEFLAMRYAITDVFVRSRVDGMNRIPGRRRDAVGSGDLCYCPWAVAG